MSKRSWVLSCAAIAVLLGGAWMWQMSRPAPVEKLEIEKLEIVPASVSLPLEGVTIGFQVKGYTADGVEAAEEQMEALDLIWEGRAEDGAFTLSEDGVVTPQAPGVGNVWVHSADGKLSARPVTVTVREE